MTVVIRRLWLPVVVLLAFSAASSPSHGESEGSFTYAIIEEGCATITGFTGDGDVAVPAILGGYPVTSIADGAFSGSAVTSVTIPASVTGIVSEAFSACYSLTSICVAASNPRYFSVDGVLCDEIASQVVRCPQGKTGRLTIPSDLSPYAGDRMDVIVLAGQSNALGYPNEPGGYGTTGESLPERLQGGQANIRSWNHTYAAWTNAPLHPHSSVYWGPEITGMDTIYQTLGRPMAIVKVAYGSTGLYDTNRWQRGGIQYLLLSNCMVRAKATLESEGYAVRWRQFWWVQGEDDSLQEATALAYETNFRNFWNDLCTDTGMSTNTAIVLAPLADHYNSAYASIVRSNQWAIGSWPNAALIVTDDLAFFSGPHYSARGYMTMGERFAAKYIEQFGSGAPETASVTSIAARAFMYCAGVVSVTLPASIACIEDHAFAGCDSLTSVFFDGDAPLTGLGVFPDASPATAYFMPGTAGWGASFAGLNAVAWNPRVIRLMDLNAASGGFGFTIVGNAGLPILVETCADLVAGVWSPAWIMALDASGSFDFSDPNALGLPSRFYRLRRP